jgi:hypothetical protein
MSAGSTSKALAQPGYPHALCPHLSAVLLSRNISELAPIHVWRSSKSPWREMKYKMQAATCTTMDTNCRGGTSGECTSTMHTCCVMSGTCTV